AQARLDGEQNPRGYLFRIAANVWRDHLRRQLTERRMVEQLTRQPARGGSPADEQVLTGDLRAAVGRAIAALPAAQREVLELRHRGDLTFREIAERLERPLGTVLSQMHAALDRVAAAVEEYR
ncbi:MAG: RNA polymerase sigma factor, partial [Gemmatimonadales bacterium]